MQHGPLALFSLPLSLYCEVFCLLLLSTPIRHVHPNTYTHTHAHINTHINAHITSHKFKSDRWPGKKREREREQETTLGRFTYLITTLTFIVWLKIIKRNNEPSRSRNVNSELRTSLNVNNFSHIKIPKMPC